MEQQSAVTYEVVDRVAVVRMAHGRVNTIDHQLLDAIHSAYRAADADNGVGAVVLASALPTVFCGGMDLRNTYAGTMLDLREFARKLYIGTLDLVYSMSKPVIAAINGPARGAGITLAITCDMAVAADNTTMGYPEIDVGLIPAIHNVHLSRQIGRAKAFELLLGGKPISTKEAERLGLINHAVPPEQVLDKAMELARLMAAKSPTLMMLARGAFMRQYDLDYRRGVEQQVEALCTAFSTADGREGLRAFVEKRAPKWNYGDEQ